MSADPWPRRRVFNAQKGEGNRRAMLQLVKDGPPPGVIGYLGDEPVAWCSIGGKDSFAGLAASRIAGAVQPAASHCVSCLFVAKEHRGAGLSVEMIEGAVDMARQAGARVVEAYPVVPSREVMPAAFAWWGVASAYQRAGFEVVARPSPTRAVMRRRVG